MASKSEIFDRKLLRDRRNRLVQLMNGGAPPDFLLDYAANDLVERLSMIKRQFRKAISVGGYHGLIARRLRVAGIDDVVDVDTYANGLTKGDDCSNTRPADATEANLVAADRAWVDEEFLAFEPQMFDLAAAVLSLQYVNDLPGVLTQIQRLLRPDGLFVGVMLGGATLQELRQVLLQAEAEMTGGASPRVIPLVDVRDAGGLLQRAGFALPVSDAETVTVTYGSALELMRELKAMGASNVMHERSRVPMSRGLLMRAAEIYAERFPAHDGDGRVAATFELVTLTGWSPDPSQQKPLRPGSAQVSLADVLKPR